MHGLQELPEKSKVCVRMRLVGDKQVRNGDSNMHTSRVKTCHHSPKPRLQDQPLTVHDNDTDVPQVGDKSQLR